jgi:hypothetical protein
LLRPALAERLLRCVALDPTEWSEYSDHNPIVATTVGERTARVVRNPPEWRAARATSGQLPHLDAYIAAVEGFDHHG